MHYIKQNLLIDYYFLFAKAFTREITAWLESCLSSEKFMNKITIIPNESRL